MTTKGHRKSSAPTASIKFVDKAICHLVFDRDIEVRDQTFSCQIYISQNGGYPAGDNFRTFNTKKTIKYEAFCDDFGPVNMHNVIHFIEILDSEVASKTLDASKARKIVYCIENGARPLTNAAFLLGAYMIIKLGDKPEDAANCFKGIGQTLMNPGKSPLESFRDASDAPADFGLELIDCFKALCIGRDLGWIKMPLLGSPDWGLIFPEDYQHYGNILNGDLHEVVPGKLIAFKGPSDLNGALYRDDKTEGTRQFSPEYYIDILQEMEVKSVIRVVEPKYNKQIFEDNDMRHIDLFFEDCTAPTAEIISQFFRTVDTSNGVIAIHGKAGLGRTGTLIALYLMRFCGFTARAAIAWVRIMRPGSILGDQQHFLCRVQSAMEDMGISQDFKAARGRDDPSGRPPPRRLSRQRSFVNCSDQPIPDATDVPRFSLSGDQAVGRQADGGVGGDPRAAFKKGLRVHEHLRRSYHDLVIEAPNPSTRDGAEMGSCAGTGDPQDSEKDSKSPGSISVKRTEAPANRVSVWGAGMKRLITTHLRRSQIQGQRGPGDALPQAAGAR